MTMSYLDIFSAPVPAYNPRREPAFGNWNFDEGSLLVNSRPADEVSWAYNPSFSGHGLRLMVECEDCGSGSQLCVAGHPGITQTWQELIYPVHINKV